MAKVAAIVMAAGRGTRFGAPDNDSKVLADLGGKPLMLHVVETAIASRASPVIVVTGHAAPRVAAALEGQPVEIVWNLNYMDGMAGSLQLGLATLPADIDGALVLLGDMPRVECKTLDAMIARFEGQEETADAIVPCFGGKAGNPVLIGRRLFAGVMRLTGDRGARSLIAQPGDKVLTLPVDDPNIHLDIDTPEMYDAVRGPA